MVEVTIYTWSFCPFCHKAKALLEEIGVEYDEHVLDDKKEELDELREKTGQRTVPQIFIGNKFIGGSSELEELNESGQLDSLLNDK